MPGPGAPSLQSQEQFVAQELAPALHGISPVNQSVIDAKLEVVCAANPPLARLVSRLVLQAGAAAQQRDLHAHVAALFASEVANLTGAPAPHRASVCIPVPAVTLLEGGPVAGPMASSLPFAEVLLGAPGAASGGEAVQALLHSYADTARSMAMAKGAWGAVGVAGGLPVSHTCPAPVLEASLPQGPALPAGDSAGAEAIETVFKWGLAACLGPPSQAVPAGASEEEEATRPPTLHPALALTLQASGHLAAMPPADEAGAPASSPRGGKKKGKGGKRAPPKPKKAAKGAPPPAAPVWVDVEDDGCMAYDLNFPTVKGVAAGVTRWGDAKNPPVSDPVTSPYLHQLLHALAAAAPLAAVVQPYAPADHQAYHYTSKATILAPAPGVSRAEAGPAGTQGSLTASPPLVVLDSAAPGTAKELGALATDGAVHGLLLRPSAFPSTTALLGAAAEAQVAGVLLLVGHDEGAGALAAVRADAEVQATAVWDACPQSAGQAGAWLVDLAIGIGAVGVHLPAPSLPAGAAELTRLSQVEAAAAGSATYAGQAWADKHSSLVSGLASAEESPAASEGKK